MMKTNRRKPSIRFRGFTDDWEQRKLSSIAERVTRKNTELQSTLPLTISAQYGLVDQVTYFNNRIASQNISNYYLIKEGEFAYNKSSSDGHPFGAVKRLERYKMGVLSTLYVVFALKDAGVDSAFLATYYDTYNWHKQVSERAAEGARNHGLLNISAEDFLDTNLMIPKNKSEQSLIGKTLYMIDHLITLHQRKYVKLLNVKKSMLEKMFPNNNRKVPEIRFKGFTDAWEQRKLGDLSSSFEYGLNAAAKEYDGENKYIRITDIDDDSREFVRTNLTSPDIDLSNAENYRLSEGDILFARTGASVGKSYIYRVSDGLVYFAGFLIKARIKNIFNPEFVFQNTLKTDYGKFIKVTSMRSGQPGVNAQEYAQYEIMVPSKLEQDKISSYLKKLDNLITLHQRKLEKLKNIKKSMLEKMFV